MTSCRSSKSTAESRTAERTADAAERVVTVYVHDTVYNTVHDTVRETNTVLLTPDGDTARHTREREHITDRSRQKTTESLRTTESHESHDREASSDEKKEETVAAQPARKAPVKTFLIGLATGAALIVATRLIRRLMIK